MTTEALSAWTRILDSLASSQGTEPRDRATQTEEAQAVLDADTLCPLTDIGAIRATGPDAVTFLHGQLTNELMAIDEAHSVPAAYCNAKGRMFALFRVLRSADGLLMLTHRELIPDLLNRLRLFVLRAKVTLSDASPDFLAIGACGPHISDALAPWGDAGSLEIDGVLRSEGVRVIRLRGTPTRFLLLADSNQAEYISRALLDVARPVGLDAWKLLDIRAGVPRIYPRTREMWVPQMVNLQLLNGISFTKGCYPGQEIVARLHYLGQLKRRMSRIVLQSAGMPSPGDRVRTLDDAQAGEIVDAVTGPDGSTEALAVLRIDCEKQGLAIGDVPVRIVDPPDRGRPGSDAAGD